MSNEPLFLPLTSDTNMAGKAGGVLTPEALRAALDALWNPPPRELSPYDVAVLVTALEQIPVMRPQEYALLRMKREEADRHAWLEGIKERLGLICKGGDGS